MSYRIALASSDGKAIDRHFGHTDEFRIIEVDEEAGTWDEIETRSLPLDDSPSVCGEGHGHHHNEERFRTAAELLQDCTYLLTERIGPKPHRILLQKEITALETTSSVETAIEKLNNYVRGAR